MTTNKLDRILAEHTFEYGNHTLLVTVRMEYGTRYNIKYGNIENSRNKGYYRIVRVRAYPKQDTTVSELKETDLEAEIVNRTTSLVRTEPEEPNITVPNNPKISLTEKILCYFSEMTEEELKQQKIEEKQTEKQEKTIPAGPAVELSTQVEETTRNVFETLDKQYQVLDRDVDLDVDVSIEKMKAEVSWVEVEDEIGRISQEIDNLTEDV